MFFFFNIHNKDLPHLKSDFEHRHKWNHKHVKLKG